MKRSKDSHNVVSHSPQPGIYITNRRLTSANHVSSGFPPSYDKGDQLTQRMTAAQLRLLRVLAVEFRSNSIEQLQVVLIRPLLERFNERPAQSPTRLSVLEGIRSS